MYTTQNFRTKKALKEAVAAGQRVTVFQPNDLVGKTSQVAREAKTTVYLEGPHYPAPHTWYAEAVTEYGVVKKVK